MRNPLEKPPSNPIPASPESNPLPTWQKFENPALQAEVAALSPEHQAKIENLKQNFVADTSTFVITRTAPLGAPKAPRDMTFVSFAVKENPAEPLERLQKRVSQTIHSQLADSLAPKSHTDVMTLAIFKNPDDPSKEILVGTLRNPGIGATLYKHDQRPNSQSFVCVVKKDSPVLDFLRHDPDARLFPFIYQSAAAEINPEALAYVDAPLNGAHTEKPGRDGNPLYIFDVPGGRIVHFSHTQTPNQPRVSQAKRPQEFREQVSKFQSLGPVIDTMRPRGQSETKFRT